MSAANSAVVHAVKAWAKSHRRGIVRASHSSIRQDQEAGRSRLADVAACREIERSSACPLASGGIRAIHSGPAYPLYSRQSRCAYRLPNSWVTVDWFARAWDEVAMPSILSPVVGLQAWRERQTYVFSILRSCDLPSIHSILFSLVL